MPGRRIFMSIGPIANISISSLAAIYNQQVKGNEQQKEQASDLRDCYIRSAQLAQITYTKPNTIAPGSSLSDIPDNDSENAYRENAQRNLREYAGLTYLDLCELVKMIIEQQCSAFVHYSPGAKIINYEAIKEAEQRMEAKSYYSVNATASRIVDYSIAISGSDTSELAEIKEAVERGFGEAEKNFGGKLPDIGYQTKAETMTRLDRWGRTGSIRSQSGLNTSE
jgi:hypothetical protein